MPRRLYDKLHRWLRYHFDAETPRAALDIALLVAAIIVFTLLAAEVVQ
jgi:hypothetical protein